MFNATYFYQVFFLCYRSTINSSINESPNKVIKSTPFLTAKKMKFSIKYFFSKCDQIRRRLRIWSHLLKKFLIENFTFCAVSFHITTRLYKKNWVGEILEVLQPEEGDRRHGVVYQILQ